MNRTELPTLIGPFLERVRQRLQRIDVLLPSSARIPATGSGSMSS